MGPQLVPKVIDALLGVRVVQVAAGGDHSLALAASGEVYAWGAHEAGALGGSVRVDRPQDYALVHQVELHLDGTSPIELACGRCHSAFLALAQRSSAQRSAEESKLKPGDIWLCGKAIAPTDHPAATREGVHRQ